MAAASVVPCAAFLNGSVNGNGVCSSSTFVPGPAATCPAMVTGLPKRTTRGVAAIVTAAAPAAGVVNWASAPVAVPDAFVATRRK